MAAEGDVTKTPQDEIRELKEKNSALVQKVQYWKMTAAQRETETIDLMKELNELRLSLSHYRSSNACLDSALDVAIQEFGENSLTRLVEVSSTITRTVEVMKTYLRKKREVESMSPSGRQSVRESIRDRSSNKVLRVVPMIRGSAIIKPTIRLRPIDATAHGLRQGNNMSEDESSSTTSEEDRTPQRHVMQDVYIPLRRIDAELAPDTVNVARRGRGAAADDSLETDVLAHDDEESEGEGEAEAEEERAAVRVGESEREEDYNAMREMDTLPEEAEDENWSPQVMLTRQLHTERSNPENPLEGPSWLLDERYRAAGSPIPPHTSSGLQLEADSTTDAAPAPSGGGDTPRAAPSVSALSLRPLHIAESPAAVHTPTQRSRHKRSRMSSPQVALALLERDWQQPGPSVTRRESTHHRDKDPTKVLVLVSKMCLGEVRRGAEAVGDEATPRRRPRAPLEAPSPNGSTQDAGPIVMDSPVLSARQIVTAHGSRRESTAARDTSRGRSTERRTRRKTNGSRRESTESHELQRESSNKRQAARVGSVTHRSRRNSDAAHESASESAHAASNDSVTHRTESSSALEDNHKIHNTVEAITSARRRTVRESAAVKDSSSSNVTVRTSATVQGTVRDSTAARTTLIASAEGGEESSAEAEESAPGCSGSEDAGRAKRRRRGAVSYKEKPLNRKLRR